VHTARFEVCAQLKESGRKIRQQWSGLDADGTVKEDAAV
jgi:hypothetical protein